MTLRELSQTLAESGIESAKADILSLAAHVSGLGKASLLARFDDEVSGEDWYGALTALTGRRRTREPLQYILGKWEFFGDEYKVTPDTLIPRPETEMLVEFAISHLPEGARVADLCCGSGCIGIAVCLHKNAVCELVDISVPALAVAEENARLLGVWDKVTCRCGDVLSGIALPGGALYDMIISNPPYVKTADINMLAPELSFEPSLALDGGDDGMTFYRAIVRSYAARLAPGGSFVFEIGYDSSDGITSLAKETGFLADITPDLSGLPRMAVLTRTK